VFTFLPGDVGANGRPIWLTPDEDDCTDMIVLVDCCLNGLCTPPFGQYSCDIDQSGAVTSADVLRLIDLWTAVVPEFRQSWLNQVPHDGGECP
jgi:hypothetical protein